MVRYRVIPDVEHALIVPGKLGGNSRFPFPRLQPSAQDNHIVRRQTRCNRSCQDVLLGRGRQLRFAGAIPRGNDEIVIQKRSSELKKR